MDCYVQWRTVALMPQVVPKPSLLVTPTILQVLISPLVSRNSYLQRCSVISITCTWLGCCMGFSYIWQTTFYQVINKYVREGKNMKGKKYKSCYFCLRSIYSPLLCSFWNRTWYYNWHKSSRIIRRVLEMSYCSFVINYIN